MVSLRGVLQGGLCPPLPPLIVVREDISVGGILKEERRKQMGGQQKLKWISAGRWY